MEFKILGGLEVFHDGRDITPTAPKLRRVLCFLILHPNQIVQTEALIDELWGDKPVRSAMTTMQTYIYLLRKTINAEVGDGVGERLLITKPSGYVAAVPRESVDLFRFEALTEEGRGALDDGDPQTASEILSQAMELWRGPALADVKTGRLLEAHVTRLEESRMRALEMRIEADLQCGRHRELISELKALTASHAYHEGFHRPLMIALYRSGRQWEALDAYQRLRRVFVSDLGLEPSADLARLQQAVLTADPSLDLDTGPVSVAPALSGAKPPSQLPPDTADFTGREEVLGQVACLLEARAPQGIAGAVPIASITGMPGVGKTALAVRAAHRVRARFPDGQLYVDLRGSGDERLEPADVLFGFLDAVGFPDERIPASLRDRSELFRAWTADRRLLVVLDDAASAEQIEALLPAGPRCGAIVTGRSVLEGASGAETVKLQELDAEEGRELLARVIGRSRVAAEPDAADAIVCLCGRSPLAIRAAGARLAALPFWSLQGFREQLVDERRRLDQLRSEDFDVRARFEDSYWRLGTQERTALRWLSLVPDAVITARSAAALLGADRAQAGELLERLTAAHFLRRVGYDTTGQTYYRFSELHRLMVCDHVVETLSESLRAC